MNTSTALPPKAQRPETVTSALTWGRIKTRYLTRGLCHMCAAQAAWGHQLGWGEINPPCSDCRPVVAMFPVAAKSGSPWRRFHQGATDTPEDEALGAQEPEQAG